MKTNLGWELSRLITETNTNQTELASKLDMTQAALSALITKDIRPKESTLRGLIHCWPGRGQQMRVLLAHLHDEARRGGMEVAKITADGQNAVGGQDDEFMVIRRVYEHDTLVKQIVDRFAALCKRIESKQGAAATEELRMVAEPAGKYRTGKDD